MTAFERFTNLVLQNPVSKAAWKSVERIAEWITSPSHVRAMQKLSRIVDSARKGEVDALKKSLRGLDKNHYENEPFVQTLLAAGAENGQKEVVQLLLDRGASANGEYNGLAHAERALMAGHISIVEILYKHQESTGLPPSGKLSQAFSMTRAAREKEGNNDVSNQKKSDQMPRSENPTPP